METVETVETMETIVLLHGNRARVLAKPKTYAELVTRASDIFGVKLGIVFYFYYWLDNGEAITAELDPSAYHLVEDGMSLRCGKVSSGQNATKSVGTGASVQVQHVSAPLVPIGAYATYPHLGYHQYPSFTINGHAAYHSGTAGWGVPVTEQKMPTQAHVPAVVPTVNPTAKNNQDSGPPKPKPCFDDKKADGKNQQQVEAQPAISETATCGTSSPNPIIPLSPPVSALEKSRLKLAESRLAIRISRLQNEERKKKNEEQQQKKKKEEEQKKHQQQQKDAAIKHSILAPMWAATPDTTITTTTEGGDNKNTPSSSLGDDNNNSKDPKSYSPAYNVWEPWDRIRPGQSSGWPCNGPSYVDPYWPPLNRATATTLPPMARYQYFDEDPDTLRNAPEGKTKLPVGKDDDSGANSGKQRVRDHKRDEPWFY